MGRNPALMLVLQFLAIGLVFYFLIIRPQGVARKKAAAMLAAIKKNDLVTTAGGVIGKVKQVRDLELVIESGTAELVIERARIIRVGDISSPGTMT